MKLPAGQVAVRAAGIAVLAGSIAGCGGQTRQPLPTATSPVLGGRRVRTDQDLFVRKTVTIGYSVDRRPIRAVFVGDPDVRHPILVVGCIHGNEPAGIAVAKRLILRPSQAEPEPALWVVPVLNPDGLAAQTRQNARGVDLNRNFPTGWRPLHQPGDTYYQGPQPLSEPESQAISRLILKIRPAISIWFHQHQDLVDLSGGNPRIERRFAHMTRLPVHRLNRYPGSAATWENHADPRGTAFVVELPPGKLSAGATARFAHTILTLAHTVQRSDLPN
ncbi:MAG TPA: DUF2817 domain-containing protein [Solirubrobacteraceae bacterium]